MSSSDVRFSVSPSSEKFPIPQQSEYATELNYLRQMAEKAREEGKEVVVVMGVGFVGVVMAAIVADTRDKNGKKFKICHRVPKAKYSQLLENPDAQLR